MSVFVKATASRSRSLKTILGGIAIVGASALVLSGCAPAADTGSSSGPREPLTLKIGTILPQSGTLAFLGPPEEAGVALAVKEINEADLGIQVEVEYRDSGDTTTDTATVSVTDLLSLDVSAIVGAASSGVSKTVIDQIVAAGVVQFSPANTSIDFTDYADDGLYWRTAPSDVLQGEVLGNQIAEDGVQNLGIIELNDSYGTGLTKKITETFEAAGGKVVASPLFNTGDTVFTTQISEVLAANPDAIALVTFDEAKIIVPALQGAGYTGPLYFVDGNLADYSAVFAAGALDGDKGTLPGLDTAKLGDFTDRLLEVNPDLTDFSYAAESYDAVVLLALAALAANSTDGKAIASKLQEVSGGSGDGTKATDFASAAQIILDGGVVDYDGNSGPITFDENGDPTEATIGIFQYGPDNTYKRIN
ncbi:MAG TPA: ABC transporter substrate-binding protein [Rhodoglobus sp.]|jgi:branched-chain amino acid transport system substrate-binding protein|nr:ABC transporter substrate-binding protein [Rhodoglobus sp.]HOW00146.1 ABC transporter substrate-binding protein [Rhodoglobus sp.]HPU02543.1 ABC transporter substrate-binding protein [Rhodoglobus sp.]HQA22095.1 ABC transporter substrate-binding protein [Rhodoglobus sp.]HQG68910.1 ABC transporter substrate-binding protein [Rhodoglobus sp.]